MPLTGFPQSLHDAKSTVCAKFCEISQMMQMEREIYDGIVGMVAGVRQQMDELAAMTATYNSLVAEYEQAAMSCQHMMDDETYAMQQLDPPLDPPAPVAIPPECQC